MLPFMLGVGRAPGRKNRPSTPRRPRSDGSGVGRGERVLVAGRRHVLGQDPRTLTRRRHPLGVADGCRGRDLDAGQCGLVDRVESVFERPAHVTERDRHELRHPELTVRRQPVVVQVAVGVGRGRVVVGRGDVRTGVVLAERVAVVVHRELLDGVVTLATRVAVGVHGGSGRAAARRGDVVDGLAAHGGAERLVLLVEVVVAGAGFGFPLHAAFRAVLGTLVLLVGLVVRLRVGRHVGRGGHVLAHRLPTVSVGEEAAGLGDDLVRVVLLAVVLAVRPQQFLDPVDEGGRPGTAGHPRSPRDAGAVGDPATPRARVDRGVVLAVVDDPQELHADQEGQEAQAGSER